MWANLRARTTHFLTPVGESAWVFLCFLIASFVVAGVFYTDLLGLESWAETPIGQLYAGALIYTLTVIGVVTPLALQKGRQIVLETLGVLKKPGVELLWMPFAVWVAYMLVTTVVALAAPVILPWIDANQTQEVGFDNLNTVFEYIMAFVALVVLPPVAEELLFRGYLFGRLRDRYNFWPTALVVSVVFGLVHAQWNVGIDVFILSLFLCYVREQTGAVWVGMVVHALKNALAYFFLFIGPLIGIHLV